MNENKSKYYRVSIDWDYISELNQGEKFWFKGGWHQQVHYTGYRTGAMRIRPKDLDQVIDILMNAKNINEEFIYVEPIYYVGPLAKIYKRWH